MMNKLVANILKVFLLAIATYGISFSALALPFKKSLLISKFASWGISSANKKSSINLLPAWKNFKHKKDVIVAVIDTGIDPKHPFLRRNIYTTKGTSSPTNYGLDFSKKSKKINQPWDTHGHGTHVAGIVKSIFPKVKILSLKYYNPNASGQENLNATIKALKYAVNMNVDIINYSGGGPEPAIEELRILKLAEKKGILVVAAAGNKSANIDIKGQAFYPASYGLKNIISVAAHDQNLKMIRSSNYAKKTVDIFAPGYKITSSFPHGRMGKLTGTSQATAFVTGVAALMLAQFPALKAIDIKKIIKSSAQRGPHFQGKCSSNGRLDAARAQNLASLQMTIHSPHRKIATKKPFKRRPKKAVQAVKKRTRKKKRIGKVFYRHFKKNI